MMLDTNAADLPDVYQVQVVEIPSPAAPIPVDPEQVREQALHYMPLLDGWCAPPKAATLVDLILKTKPETVVEIGVWGGKSLVPMATAVRANGRGKVYGIDPWDSNASTEECNHPDNKAFWGNVDHGAVMRGLIMRIREFGLDSQIELIRATSEEAYIPEDIDILHIDGNHSDKTSYFDVQKWVPQVKRGGWIIFDDMTWYEEGKFTTARAVQWLNENCIKLGEFSDNCVWGIWVKP